MSAAAARVVKYSISIAGHRTSISLETAFWEALRDIAATRDCSVAALVADIDTHRGAENLSSAVRVYVLRHHRGCASCLAEAN